MRTPNLDTKTKPNQLSGWRDFPFTAAGGSQQVCYSQPGCVGDIVSAPGPTARDCCAGTDNGQSYSNDGVNCHVSQCIGKYSASECRIYM